MTTKVPSEVTEAGGPATRGEPGPSLLDRPTHRIEIDYRTLRLAIGIIALTLGWVTRYFAGTPLGSISESYYHPGPAQTYFIGSLFAIATFLFAYNGHDYRDMLASKIAGLAALGVALFPCTCARAVGAATCLRQSVVPYVHWISALLMFAALAWFCLSFYRQARRKAGDAPGPRTPPGRRALVYACSGIVIVVTMLILLFYGLAGPTVHERWPQLVFWGELAALTAFGASWLTASQVLPVLTHAHERMRLGFGQQSLRDTGR